MTKLSVCIPTYNRASLSDTLESILEAKSQDDGGLSIEICVSDNCSTPETKEIVDRWREKLPGIHYSRSEQFLELSESVIRSTTMASGDYVAVVSDDDALEQNYFERLGKVLREDPDVVYVETNMLHPDGWRYEKDTFSDLKLGSRKELLEAVGVNLNFLSAVIVKGKYFRENLENPFVTRLDPRNYFKYLLLWLSVLPKDAKSIFVRTPLISQGIGQQKSHFGKAFFSYLPQIVKELKRFGYDAEERRILMRSNLDVHMDAHVFNILKIPLFTSFARGLRHYALNQQFLLGMLEVYRSRTDLARGRFIPSYPLQRWETNPIEAGSWDLPTLLTRNHATNKGRLFGDGWLGDEGVLTIQSRESLDVKIDGVFPENDQVESLLLSIQVGDETTEKKLTPGEFSVQFTVPSKSKDDLLTIRFTSDQVFPLLPPDQRKASVYFSKLHFSAAVPGNLDHRNKS